MNLVTTWDEHYMIDAYLSSLHWALGEQEIVGRYRSETGDNFSPAGTALDRMIDKATGAELAFLQRFSDWHELTIFGRREDVFPEETGP